LKVAKLQFLIQGMILYGSFLHPKTVRVHSGEQKPLSHGNILIEQREPQTMPKALKLSNKATPGRQQEE
jgi:hypothetical protein